MKEPELISRELVFSGRRLKVFRDVIKFGDVEAVREVVDFGTPVAILPILKGDIVVLERQYRHPVGSWIIEIPAGLAKQGESLEEAAKRELFEETGYTAEKLWILAKIFPSPGYCKEKLTIFVAEDLKKVSEGAREADEFIEVFHVPLKEALRMVFSGEISDGKTIVALLLYASKRGLLCEATKFS